MFLGVFENISDTCFKCFICLQTYIASVISKYFKSRLDVAYVAIGPACCSCWRGREGSGGAQTSLGVGRGVHTAWARVGRRCCVGSGSTRCAGVDVCPDASTAKHI